MRALPRATGRSFASLLLVGATSVAVACTSVGHTADPRPTGTATAPTTPGASAPPGSPTPDASPSASGSPAPALPRCGRRLFPRCRVVAFYGTANTPAMGVLGTGAPDQVWHRLVERAARFRLPHHPVLPAYELIVTIADDFPGADGSYSHRIEPALIEEYLAAARRHDALLILDVQPGRSTFPSEVRWLRRWLAEPDVALALDPEWRMGSGGVPGHSIGSVRGQEVNEVSAWLDDLTAAHDLPQKLLLVHQFTEHMVVHKGKVAERDHLAIAFNMDGFGAPADKKVKYRMLREHTRFDLGFKLFLHQDVDMLSPRQVLALHPPPRVVEYQ